MPVQLKEILKGVALIILCRIALSGVAFNIVSLLNFGTGGEAFIYYKLQPIIKQRL